MVCQFLLDLVAGRAVILYKLLQFFPGWFIALN